MEKGTGYLTLTRRPTENIYIRPSNEVEQQELYQDLCQHDIEIVVLKNVHHSDEVMLGIRAPKSMNIVRSEIDSQYFIKDTFDDGLFPEYKRVLSTQIPEGLSQTEQKKWLIDFLTEVDTAQHQLQSLYRIKSREKGIHHTWKDECNYLIGQLKILRKQTANAISEINSKIKQRNHLLRQGKHYERILLEVVMDTLSNEQISEIKDRADFLLASI